MTQFDLYDTEALAEEDWSEESAQTQQFACDTPMRLDAFLVSVLPEHSRAFLQKRIDSGDVTVDGAVKPKNHKLKVGQTVCVTIPPPTQLETKAENIPLDIVYEDKHLLVVNKPKGMVVHPAAGNYEHTLVNALLYHCGDSLSGIGGVIRPGIVHRIDKNTSGLLMVAKNDEAHIGLAEQIKAHSFLREYEAVVYGNVKEDRGIVDQPIGRSKTDRKKMAITALGKPAVTHYEVLARYRGFTHIRCRLETGRTHQIRVHMASLGHPVAGDEVYGPKKVITSLSGQCLHAKTVGFTHPITGEALLFTSELPPYFEQFLRSLAKQL